MYIGSDAMYADASCYEFVMRLIHICAFVSVGVCVWCVTASDTMYADVSCYEFVTRLIYMCVFVCVCVCMTASDAMYADASCQTSSPSPFFWPP